MTSARRSSAMIVAPLLGLLIGGVAGYLVAQGLHPGPNATIVDHSVELAEIRTELTELKAQIAPASVEDQVEQLQALVTDILLRGDELSLRADFARTADRLDGHAAADFALCDADEDGTADLEQLKQRLDGILSGATPVARAKKADSAGNTEFLGDLPLTDFALSDHSHPSLAGDVRVGGALSVSGNTIASGDVQVFGEVVAVGGLLPGTVNVDPKPAIAGMIRYNRGTGALEYCDGASWNEVAVVQQP